MHGILDLVSGCKAKIIVFPLRNFVNIWASLSYYPQIQVWLGEVTNEIWRCIERQSTYIDQSIRQSNTYSHEYVVGIQIEQPEKARFYVQKMEIEADH